MKAVEPPSHLGALVHVRRNPLQPRKGACDEAFLRKGIRQRARSFGGERYEGFGALEIADRLVLCGAFAEKVDYDRLRRGIAE
jgi:hypothetical protein